MPIPIQYTKDFLKTWPAIFGSEKLKKLYKMIT